LVAHFCDASFECSDIFWLDVVREVRDIPVSRCFVGREDHGSPTGPNKAALDFDLELVLVQDTFEVVEVTELSREVVQNKCRLALVSVKPELVGVPSGSFLDVVINLLTEVVDCGKGLAGASRPPDYDDFNSLELTVGSRLTVSKPQKVNLLFESGGLGTAAVDDLGVRLSS